MNPRLKRLWAASVSLLVLLIVLSTFSAMAYAQKSGEAYVYCFPQLFLSRSLLDYLDNKSDLEVTACDLNETSFLATFLNLTRTLSVLGVQVIGPDLCTTCELKRWTWDEILTLHASPLAGFFRDERLTAITIGTIDPEILDKAMAANGDDVKVFTQYAEYSLPDVRDQLQEFFPSERSDETQAAMSKLVLPLTLLALADSVNPCTFALFTALLLITLHSLGEMRAAATGFSFILAVFIGYYVLGLGVFRVLVSIPYIDKALALVGLALGVFNIVRGLNPMFKSPVPRPFRNFVESRMKKSHTSIIASFGLGLLATFTLLPCSGGPYIVGLGLLSALKDAFQVHLLLALYNLVFVMPLVLIASTVLASSSISRRIRVFRSTKLGIMELVSGALLAVVCAYLLVA